MPALRSDKADEDSRLFIERLLLPPGTTCSRAASTGLFFFMLYCFDRASDCPSWPSKNWILDQVWTSWYIAGISVLGLPNQKNTPAFYATSSCPFFSPTAFPGGRPSDLPRRSRRFGGWSPFPGSDVGRPCLSRKTGIQVSFTAPVYAEDGYLSPPTNSCSEQSEARLAERSEMPS
ncbi:unnamed protein product [Durusdinium trenchii]|uniref:Uncharacterized protein n=1 Tax=Durusdinium trenchii TaxID=1381693 RepID=A0ABP0RY60_9DINO